MNRRRASASYVARASSGRPGSPHRYFEGSYDVILELMTGEGNGDDARKSGPSPDGDTTDDQPTLARVGRQVVHRHKNGLCIVTAGDVLERMVILWIDETNERNNDFGLPTMSCGDHPLSITALRFHVKVDKDAKSARGKIRSRNKNHRKRRNKPGNSVVMNELRMMLAMILHTRGTSYHMIPYVQYLCRTEDKCSCIAASGERSLR